MKKQKGYLVAAFSNFPGVKIPLISKEECQQRGIEPGSLPAFSTWTPQQQESGRRLAKVLCEMAVSQAFRSIAKELDLMVTEGNDAFNFEQEAARRVRRQLDAGKWKPPALDDAFGLDREVGWAIDSFLGEQPIVKDEARASLAKAAETSSHTDGDNKRKRRRQSTRTKKQKNAHHDR